MELHFEIEKMNAVFTKHHIKGLPFNAVLHHFSEKDINDHIHDHPFSFTSFVLHGSYVERVYKNGKYKDMHRKKGDSFRVKATHIHEIIDLPDGECFTVILPEPWEREEKFYNRDELLKN